MKDPRTLLNKQVTQTTQPNTANKTGMKDPRTLPKSTTQMSSTPSQSPGINAFNILNNATKAQSYNDVNSINNKRSNIVTPSTNVPTFKTLEDAQKYANDNNIKVNSPTKEQVEKIEDKNKLTNLYKDKIKLPNQRMYKTPYQSITNTNYGIDEKTKKIIEESKPLAEGEKAWYEKIIKAPEIMKDNNRRFVDGYQFGDITQTALENIGDSILTIGGTVGDLALGAAKGFAGLGEKMANLPAAGIAQIADWTGNDEFANKLRTNIGNGTGKWLSPHIEKAQEAVDSASISAEYMDKTAETGGQVFGMVAGGKVLGTAGNIPIKLGTHTLNIPTLALLSGSGSGAEEAYSKENVSNVQAWTKIISSGLIEGFSEGLFGLLGVGGNDVTEELAKKAISKMSSGAGKVFAKLGFAGTGEATEEFISYALNWLVDNGITNNIGKGDFSSEWDWNEVGEQMALAFVSSGLTQGGSSMIEINRQTQIGIQDAEKTLNRPLTVQEQQSIRNQVIDYVLTDGEINTHEENKQELENNSSSINLQQNNQIRQPTNEVIPQQLEKQNNTNIVKNTSTNENISQNNIQQSLGTEQVRNAEVTREIQTFVDNRNKIFPGLSVEFDSTLNTDGVIEKRADGTRIIKINPNSSRAYEFVAVHEMLHDLEGAKEQYQDLSSFVKERAMTHEDFEMAKSNLTEQYTKYYQENGLDMSNLNMENETVNDMVARALGNQDFLNELAGNKPNVFMRMYNWIKNVLLDGQNTGKTFRERRADNKYLQELKSKFEIAYNTAYKGKASQQYSIQEDSNGNKYVKVDTDQDIFRGIEPKDYNKIAKMYMQDYLKGKTNLTQNDIANIGKIGISKYTNPKQQTRYINEKMQLTPELKNVLQIAEKISEGKPTKDNSKFPSWEYYKVNFEINGIPFEGIVNIGIDKDGNKQFYEINKIRTTSHQSFSTVQSSNTNLIKDSIPSNNSTVNNQYMQDSSNNTQGLEKSSSFSLGKNASNTLPEVSKGYTRLYRGLTQEYNADYDKSKIDNSNGYESWTDNYELAKAYGNNVYYIDIPTSQIKDTIIDENSKSETYGDRNLVYKNNKPVGIKGKSGNEYMLYTDHDDFASIQYNKVPTSKQVEEYSQTNDKWQSYLDKNWDLMPNSKKTFGFPMNEQIQAMDNKKIAENVDTLNLKEKKIKSLEDIADMTEADLRNEKGVNYKHKKDKNTQYERKFFENVETSKIINQDIKDTIEITTYERQANEETLAKANEKLDEQGDKLIKQWQNKTKNFTAEDVAIGAILIERYQQMGDTESAVNVVQKLADMGTEVGRAVQMYSIFQRLTPDAMMVYQQRKLNDVFKEVSQRKTGEWVEANKEKFKLTADDSKFITEQVEKAQQATNERQKQIELAKIESRINDKLPPERGQTIKAIRRIAMLFNPKTQVRNVVGNALIMPVNDVADFIGTQIDKAIAKKTGIRTTNYANLKEKFKGFKKGITESIEDYKLGIRTEPTGSKYEFDFGGKSFNENTKSKTLNYINNKMNGINNLLGAVMSGGDRPFYEAAFNNSLQGQMKANNVTTPTPEMIDIAVNEALARTWNDSNNYTQAVLGIRREMNKLNIGGFGLGDLIIPFAKTPANLTKAMVEYSPLGTIEAIINYSDMKKAISRGEMTAQQQKNFVNSTSKAIAGSILYLIAGAIAQTGAITGSADDDKDVRNFEQNVLGIQPYSIKIGDKTFTYSWANPLNAPLAIMADTYKMSKENASLFDILTNGFKTAGEVIVENSFLQGIKELFEADSISEGLTNAVVNMPSQFIPTFLSQFATFGDKNKRQTFEYGDKLKTTINQIKTKTPGLKNTLAPTVNTFGEEIQNYGGENNVFNVFLNPSNVSKANATDTQKELYALYEATKDKTIFPRQAPYYLSDDGEKINLSSYERAEYQKISGKYVSENLGALFDSEFYKTLENEQKVEVINEIVSDADTIAKDNWIDTNTTKKIAERNEKLKDVPLVDYYNAWIAQKDVEGKKNLKGETISGTKKKAKIKAINEAVDDDLTAEQKKILYGIFNLD